MAESTINGAAADTAQSAAPNGGASAASAPQNIGRWDPPFPLPNVAIHAHVLPNRRVLFWGRRDDPANSLDVHETTPHLWDPTTKATVATAQPTLADGTKINLFCSGHAFLSDGKLFVVGGHLADGEGLNSATTYDYRTNAWTPLPIMNKGRWYPTALTLSNGSMLAFAGSYLADDGKSQVQNNVPQIWDSAEWRQIANFSGDAPPLYPRMHVAPDGQVFMSGWLAQSYRLDPTGMGTWSRLPGASGSRANGLRDYAPAVMYDVGKIVFIGGGQDRDSHAPTAAAEIIDLTAASPGWQATGSMHHPRRQHNATVLPDGTVLVTGGTSGGSGPHPGFNDLTTGAPVHAAEIWNPATGQWTEVAAEAVDRCYHSTAVLLPDATVLSAGSGEYKPDNIKENDPKDSHRDAQIFYPPYLFRGSRPDIAISPAESEVVYGQTFSVGTSRPQEIRLVSWIRLPSVTHANDYNQRINFLRFVPERDRLSIVAPDRPEICPPGHYMLFLLNEAGVPSIAEIIRIAGSSAAPPGEVSSASRRRQQMAAAAPAMDTEELDRLIVSRATGTRVVVGLTSKCPYGLGACWGGAYEALQKLSGVAAVRPIPNAEDSTAELYLRGDSLPNLDTWPEQISLTANGSYHFRGVEITVRGTLGQRDGALQLSNPGFAQRVTLAPFEQQHKIQWNIHTGANRPAIASELAAYSRLLAELERLGGNDRPARITGPLRTIPGECTLYVSDYEIQS